MSAALQTNMPIVDLHSALAPDTLAAWLAGQFSPHQDRTTELVAAYKRFLVATAAGIVSDDVAGRSSDLVRQVKASIKAMDDTRVATKAPVLAAQRQIDGVAKALTDQLLPVSQEIERRLTVYMAHKAAEARRIATEEAAAKAAEAQKLLDEAAKAEETAERMMDTAIETGETDDIEIAASASTEAQAAAEQATAILAQSHVAAAAAQAPVAELTKMRTQMGGTAALKDNWVFEIADLAKVPVAYLTLNESVVKAAIKTGVRIIPGLTIRNEPKAAIR